MFNLWNSLFLLAEKGESSGLGSLIRVIKEGNMQIELFALEATEKNRYNLDRWFSGQIIEHVKGRKKVAEFFKNSLPNNDVDLEKLSSHIYQMESQASHNAYTSILELVSPFFEDYDFDGYSSCYRTIAWLRYASGSLETTNVTLKLIYSTVINDEESYKKIDEILIKYNPKMDTKK